jgi:hypothetical protein
MRGYEAAALKELPYHIGTTAHSTRVIDAIRAMTHTVMAAIRHGTGPHSDCTVPYYNALYRNMHSLYRFPRFRFLETTGGFVAALRCTGTLCGLSPVTVGRSGYGPLISGVVWQWVCMRVCNRVGPRECAYM